jgi:2-polyprenyl-3-methyl-5-hydroxy-6-metoxy-1,4-benzoquinol methylase
MSNLVWHDDPKRITFVLSRYKFVAKMLSGCKSVLEIGCADGFGSRIVRQEVGSLTALDFDPVLIDSACQINDAEKWPIDFIVHDVLDAPPPGNFDGIYLVDVLEHIQPNDEILFVENILGSLNGTGTLIVGVPTLESQAHASEISRQGHVNCKTATELKALLSRYFYNVFIFSMNDEVIHTGFTPMAHYVFALCCHKKVV